MTNNSMDVTIRDLLDVIHETIIKKENENSVALNEIQAFEKLLHNGTLKNYSVNGTTFWKVIIANQSPEF